MEGKENLNYNLLANMRYVLSNIRKLEKGLVFFTLLSIIIASLSTFISAFVLKEIIDNLGPDVNPTSFINNILIVLLAITVLMLIKTVIDNMVWWRVVRLRTKIIIDKNEKFNTLNYQTVENPEVQDLAEKASRAVSSQSSGFEGIYNYSRVTLENLITVFIASAIIFTANLWLIVVTIILVITKFLARNKVEKVDKLKYWDQVSPYRRKLRYINSVSRNKDIAKDLRIYDMKSFIEKEQTAIHDALHEKLNESEKRRLKLESFLQFITLIQEFILYGILIYEVINDNLTIGNFTLMLSSVRILSSQLTQFFHNYATLLTCGRQLNDLRKFMELENDENEYLMNIPNEENYTIEFKNVYFRYLNQEGYALENISFTIKPGQKIALVGYNGAGKTTLVKLLCGLYTPEKGEILLNGVNVKEYFRDDYFKLFAPVFQDNNYFAFDIGENVAMSYKSNVDYNRAYEALTLAGLNEKVDSLPKQIYTPLLKFLEEDGTELSGGEIQKLVIARAIYKNGSFFILDEPTSALDAIAEYNLYNNFNSIIGSNSAIYISHRLASTRFCDEIILLDKGKIIEKGTHQELLNQDGKYKKLFDIQAKYYKEEGVVNGY